MKSKFQMLFITLTLVWLSWQPGTAAAAGFEGRIATALTRGGEATPLLQHQRHWAACVHCQCLY